MAEKVTRLLPSQGLNRDQHDCLARLASLCGKVRTDARHPCSGVSTAPQSPYDLRDAWMAEVYARHGLPAWWGKATLAAAMSPRPSAREVAKVPVQKAVRHRARGDNAECRRLYGLLKQNRWTEDPFLHWQMRKQWQGGQSVPCGERDCGRRRFLHHQGLTRTGLDPICSAWTAANASPSRSRAYTCLPAPSAFSCRARVAGIGFAVATGLCWTRMRNILARLYGEEIALYIPCGDVRSARGTNQDSGGGRLHPDSSWGRLATRPPSTESESPAPVPFGTG